MMNSPEENRRKQTESLFRAAGGYRNLKVYRLVTLIYDVTVLFTERYIPSNSRTRDQMVQAARSGKQNIVEGSTAATTSAETHIKLLNVAKASFHELLMDYEDYLRVRELVQWKENDAKFIQTRKVCASHNESEYYRNAIKSRSPETIANIAITLLHQEDYLLLRLIEKAKSQFLETGGIREQMTKARINYRNKKD